MRRATVHALFATAAAVLLAFALWQAYRLVEHRRIVAAIVAVPASLDAPSIDADRPDYPQALLAQAGALSAGGRFEAAEALYVALIDQHRAAPLGRAARFNLANHYLREGMRQELQGPQTRALIETAKQRYRDLLRVDSLDWDARYNLEIALRLAPEQPEDGRTSGPPPERVRVIVPDFEVGDLP